MYMPKYCPTAKPATPTLTAVGATDIEGGTVTLTCASATASIDSYEFFKDDTSLGSATGSDVLTINTATITDHNGDYTCQVTLSGAQSDSSSETAVQCECSRLYYLIWS